jgi:hypothetical protein
VKVRLNLHGCVAVESATQVVEEEYEEPVKVAKREGAQAQAQAAADAAQPADQQMQVRVHLAAHVQKVGKCAGEG